MNQTLVWKIIFFVFLAILIALTALSLAIFFLMPATPVAITLPLKYWLMLIFGGIGKEFFAGFFTYYSYRKWKDASNKVKT